MLTLLILIQILTAILLLTMCYHIKRLNRQVNHLFKRVHKLERQDLHSSNSPSVCGMVGFENEEADQIEQLYKR